MGFLIRAARPDDVDRLVDINIRSWQESYGNFLSAEFLAGFDNPRTREAKTAAFTSMLDGMSVSEVDGQVRGYAAAGPARSEVKPRDLELFMIYQQASEHGSGSGQALLDAVIGERPAFLWVAEQNHRGIAFYRRNGFEPDGGHQVAEQWEDLAEIRMVR
jgi:ribosomal protein S18 acetylase RimI-like enzyme